MQYLEHYVCSGIELVLSNLYLYLDHLPYIYLSFLLAKENNIGVIQLILSLESCQLSISIRSCNLVKTKVTITASILILSL